MMLTTWIRILSIGGLVGIGAVASWAALDTAFHLTGDYEFCTGCHSYAPIAASYREDRHGGNNPTGMRAACNDCHLPHDNSLHYFFVKARHGVVDPVMEIIKAPEDIDWHGNRQHRERFVYDSGCLSCHKYLQKQTQQNPKAFRPHRDYFAAPSEHSCVGCHEHVGHHRLGYHLEQAGWQRPLEESP
jgi:cytochrome c-type protein NapC